MVLVYMVNVKIYAEEMNVIYQRNKFLNWKSMLIEKLKYRAKNDPKQFYSKGSIFAKQKYLSIGI